MTATTRTAEEKLKEVLEELTCPICLEFFVEPRLLPCSHTFCYGCMRGLVRSQHVKCPTCRKVTLLQEEGIRCLPRNRALSNIVAKIRDNHPEHCSGCRDLLATVSCQACGGKFYCDECAAKAHARLAPTAPPHPLERVPPPPRRDGRSAADAAALRASYKCPVHSYKEVRFYCLTDGASVCKHCILKGDHLGHRYVLLKEGAMRARTALYAAIKGAQGLVARLEESSRALRSALLGEDAASAPDALPPPPAESGEGPGGGRGRGRELLCRAREVRADVEGGVMEAERVIREGDCLSIIHMREDFDALLASLRPDALLADATHFLAPAPAPAPSDAPAPPPSPHPLPARPALPGRRGGVRRGEEPDADATGGVALGRASAVLAVALQRVASAGSLSERDRDPEAPRRPPPSREPDRPAHPHERPPLALPALNSPASAPARSLSQSPRHQRPSGTDSDAAPGEDDAPPGLAPPRGLRGGLQATLAPEAEGDEGRASASASGRGSSPSPVPSIVAELRRLGTHPVSSPNLGLPHAFSAPR
eukprot:tig00000215_g18664.t1